MGKKTENRLEKREKYNLILFIVSYIINNLASGVLYDTYVNYLQEVSVSIATSFWAFYGYATFISAAVLLLIPKLGYKKILILCAAGTSAAFFGAVFVSSPWILTAATLLALTGVQIHFIILAPYVSVYTESIGEEGIKWYTRTYYMGYVGYFLATYLGGVLVVKAFSAVSGLTYSVAKQATRFVADMGVAEHSAYLKGNEYVLIAVGVLALLSIIPVLMIREKEEDYKSKVIQEDSLTLREKISGAGKALLNKDAVFYLIFWMLISFAMGLFTSYYTVFLNRNLHIDKATSSLMVSISYIAIIVFMFFTPLAVKKLGKVGTIFFSVALSVPFMLIIANGDKFGDMMIPAVGTALFVRAGLANLSSPAESSLSMSVVPKELRPAYTAVVNFVAGIVSIISGTFTGKILFVTQEGYRQAYYIAAVLYAIAAVVVMLGLKKYNRVKDPE